MIAHSIILFFVTLLFVLVMTAKYKISPFITLISAAFLYGLFSGVDPGALTLMITAGAARIFQILGIMVFCGVCIAHMLRQSGYIDVIVKDIGRYIKSQEYTSGIGGFILSIPLMCCNTAFVVLAPIIEQKKAKHTNILLYTAAIASIISFVLIYPSPFVVPIVSVLLPDLADPFHLNLITIPVALLMLALLLYFVRRHVIADKSVDSEKETGIEDIITYDITTRVKAWAPIVSPIILMSIGILFSPFSFLSNISIALFIGLIITMLVVSKQSRDDGIHNGTKYSGLIMFDLCGAGALGAVISQSSFPQDIFQLSLALPLIFIPFVLALFLQAATGSRVVSAATTAHILAAATTTMPSLSGSIHSVALVLMIAGGSCMVSFVSDPYFWLVKRFTKDDMLGAVERYTLPLMGIGALIGAIGILIQIILTNT